MKSHFYHIQINIDFNNLDFYKRLMSLLGWDVIFETDDTIGYKSITNGDIWFVDTEQDEKMDYDHRGLSHIALRADSQNDIDDVHGFLLHENLKASFGTPVHRPDFVDNDADTYYQIIFITPDNVQVEIVYIGIKSLDT